MSVFQFHRAGAIDLDGSNFTQVARTFTKTARDNRVSTLLVVRGASGMDSYLVGDVSSASHLARAVGAEFEEVTLDTECLSVGAVATLHAARNSINMTRATQVGVSVDELSKALDRAMPPNSWVAITFRAPRKGETRHHHAWINFQHDTTRTHPSLDAGQVVAKIAVGAESRAQAKSLAIQLSGAIPGFDYEVRARTRSGSGAIGMGVFLSGAALVAGFFLDWPMAMSIAVAALLFGVFTALGVYAFTHTSVDGEAAMKMITTRPPGRATPPRKGKKKYETNEQGYAEEKVQKPDYPLALRSFMLGPEQIAGLVAPQAGTSSGQTSTRTRSVPPIFTQNIGPLVGSGHKGEAVHLSARDLYGGVLALGEPGSGKTVLLRQLYAWCLLQKARGTSNPGGSPGTRNTLIAFENKGVEDVAIYQQWAATFSKDPRDQVYVIDLYDPNSIAIDLTATGNEYTSSALSRAEYFVEAMTYSFTDGSIAHASRQTLLRLLTAGIAIEKHPELTQGINQMPPVVEVVGQDGQKRLVGGSFVEYADILCASKGDDVAAQLAAVVAGTVANPGPNGVDPDLVEAAAQLAPLFSAPRTPAQRRDDFKAPSSKLRELMKVKGWFSPTRTRVPWWEVLTSHSSFVLNLGKSATGQVPTGELKTIMSSMLTFTLQSQIEQHCAGWDAHDRRVSLFSDELSLMAGTNPEVFRWFRDQGRSYGVNLFVATQYLDQLEPRLKSTVMGLASMFALTQGSPQVADEIARFLSSDGQEWEALDVVTLPRHSAILRSTVSGSKQPAFTLKLGYWENEMDAFAQDQGA